MKFSLSGNKYLWFTGGAGVAFGLSFALVAFAWTGPTASPPNNDASPPLNTSNAGQIKAGGLELNSGGATTGLIVYGNLCLGGTDASNCINSWVQAIGQWQTNADGNDIYNNNLGDVSIGTTTPLRPLFVQSAIPGGMVGYYNSNPSGFTSFDIFNQSETVAMSFGHGNTNTGQWSNMDYINGNGYVPIDFEENNVSVMRIASSTLYVGIGTTSPFQKLSVTGNEFVTGTITSIGAMNAPAFNISSDERLKKNIAPIASSTALADILALQPVTYNWINPALATTTQIGFIAQQVEKVVPELVTTDPSTTLEALDYSRFAPLLSGAIQAQQAQIEVQQKEIDALTAEVAALEASK